MPTSGDFVIKIFQLTSLALIVQLSKVLNAFLKKFSHKDSEVNRGTNYQVYLSVIFLIVT